MPANLYIVEYLGEMKPMKSMVVAFWLCLVYLADALGSLLNTISGFTDWSLFGWAFAGSTAFVVWEAIYKKTVKRTRIDRIGMIGLGLLVSMGFNGWVTELTKIPPVPCVIGLGALGYKLFGLLQGRADKAKSIDDLTKLD